MRLRAVADEWGENAADKGADSGWMRLDEDCGGRGRALLALRGTAHAIQAAVRLCAEYLLVQGDRSESRWRPIELSSCFEPTVHIH